MSQCKQYISNLGERWYNYVFVSLYVEFYFVCTIDIILKQQLFAFLIAWLILFCSLNYACTRCSVCFYKRKHLYMLRMTDVL